jgi:penicillin-binding protein 2
MSRGRVAGLAALLALAAGCSSAPEPSPTPLPTTFPTQPPSVAVEATRRYVDAWAAGDYAAMHALLAPADRERYPLAAFTTLHATFAEMTLVEAVEARTGEPELVALPPEARPDDLPAPTPTAVPTPDASASATPVASASATPSPSPPPAPDPDAVLAGPVPAMAVPLDLSIATQRFGELELDRELRLVHGPDDWQVRWNPGLLFPELAEGATLRLDRTLGPRGEIIAADGTVFATTSPDGVRVYPQEWLAGQTIGYVSEVTAEDLATLAVDGYQAGDVVGRSGLENGAEELLRGTPGWTLVAVAPDGGETELLQTETVPGATLTITLQPEIQLAAQQALLPYGAAATAVLDPRSGDVWALASVPAFNPNAATLGSTLAGQPLPAPSANETMNKALLAAYPAGSSFKPFTLAAALQTGVVTPASLVTCPPTWPYSSDFTVHNYEDHSLPGLVTLAQAMAFSCNTTYMPLSLQVYQADPDALMNLLSEFGFGQPTGIRHLIEEIGVLPNDAWLQENYATSFGPFDQIQMAIGQGFYLGTPLQLANAYAAIGNGGTRWVPRIVASATLPDGTLVEENASQVAHQLSIDPTHLAYVTDTLQAVVTLPYGTGTAAFAGFGIPVAGKSGTAENGTPAPHAWFPAFAPADDPMVVAATVLPYIPLGTGGSDAAPLVRRVFTAYFT